MPFVSVGRCLFGAIAIVLASGPALAEGGPGPGPGYHRQAPARALPPEVRYRDPRYLPLPRRAPRVAPPDSLIQAYLPRHTDAPMYNEPPSRFPQR